MDNCTPSLIETLQALLARHSDIVELLLIGSFASGRQAEGSDIDVCIRVADGREEDLLNSFRHDTTLDLRGLDCFVFFRQSVMSLRNGSYTPVSNQEELRSVLAAQAIWSREYGWQQSNQLNAAIGAFKEMAQSDIPSAMTFSRNGEVRLEVPGKSRREGLEAELRGWMHHAIDADHIHRFVRQFGASEESQNVGRWIVANVDFYSADRLKVLLTNALRRIESKAGKAAVLAGFGAPHKSTAIAQNILGKALRDRNIYSIRDALEQMERDTSLLNLVLIDDAAFSGTQANAIFRRYLGKGEWPDNVQPLPANLQEVLRGRTVWFLTGVSTGLAATRIAVTCRNELSLEVRPVAGREEPYLSGEGYAQMHAGRLFSGDTDITDPQGCFIASAFDDERSLADLNLSRIYAESICSQINRDLLTPIALTKRWTDQRLDNSVLGYWNAGKLIAFAHSVPRASLALLWCHGRVAGKDWVPLFRS